jgi:hypothetical protein
MITMLVYGRRRPSSQPVEEIPMTSTRCPLPLMEGTDDLARLRQKEEVHV